MRKRDPQDRSRVVQTIRYVAETHRSHRIALPTSLEAHFSQGPLTAHRPPGILSGIPAPVDPSDGKPVFKLEKQV